MNAPIGTDPFAEWDAAYVLGALSADDRVAFEDHLRQCRNCRRAVTELAGVPGLLSVVPAQDALALVEHDAAAGAASSEFPPADQSPREVSGRDVSALIARVRRSRRRRRLGAVAVAAVGVAAVLVFMLAVVVPGLRPDTRELDLTLSPVTETSLSATAHLSATADGTRITTTCNYGRPGTADAEYADRAGPGTFGLFVTTADGTVEQVATWAAGPGETVHAAGHTDLDLDRIEAVQIAPADQSVVLLRADLDP